MMIRKGKNSYRRKMEHQLQQNNICGVWKGLKTISGFKEPKSQPVGDQGLLLTTHQVRNALKKNRKAAGPDGISSRLLKSCADQLCGIFGYTFNLSLKLGRVPQLWKTSCRVQGFESDRAAPVLRRERFWLLSCSPSTLQTFHTTHHHVISRSSLMTLLLLASSQMGTTESTEDLFRTLRTGACGTTSRSTLVKPRSWWWISAGVAHSPPAPVSIQGTDIDTVKSYKYLGVHLN
ncbi:hypothetical protein L3Q82_024372 [Scortum barcoo]|uniref:Uncharacterized protein n=1 Tax=Scortum barcoo TaxID=214431 RepID=A0ACB8WVN7_9TELE|nr:hypothetical protein L3Q82_024372 [Scortum barcoo]